MYFNYFYYLDYFNHNKLNTNKLCGLKSLDYKRLVEYYFLFLCFIQYFLPLIILCITFSMIAYYVNVVNAKNIKLDANKLNKNIRRKNETKVSISIIL